jgi:CheY-like chemotaxis protein
MPDNAIPAQLPVLAEKYPLRILLVEDNIINQQLALIILSRMGYSPGIAVNGKEVLDRLLDEYFDLILMDIQMPEMDGLEATRIIRATHSVQPLIIAMTANAAGNDREECLAAGMNDYLPKPISLDELVNMLEKWGRRIRQNNTSMTSGKKNNSEKMVGYHEELLPNPFISNDFGIEPPRLT